MLVEDCGLAIRAWGGFPGALVKWLEKSAGVDGIARMLDAVPRPRARRRSASSRYFDGGEVVDGARRDARARSPAAPRGAGGFGWDSIFVPEGGDRTFAEMAPEEKDRVSHRRRAWEAHRRRRCRSGGAHERLRRATAAVLPRSPLAASA